MIANENIPGVVKEVKEAQTTEEIETQLEKKWDARYARDAPKSS